ncbi:DUF1294 domain-containing protein [Pontiella agarivorans]|uniref:DUF1294 domain-containing protein n=1 Tax=Pontiella agarivorans TaxID=3038953 RepID=A0ABU5N112_9BACT|nr:DUF1294 domain-containing protein [Pontiella agarivorans]MDZ8120135.1 DUF1294 domain-containing protein [Pontiella agarivorans]
MTQTILYILGAANLGAFIQMAIDKRLAIKERRRIPEAQLIAPTFFGGFPGILLGMLVFHHKTQKRSFQLKLLIAVIIFSAAIYACTRL